MRWRFHTSIAFGTMIAVFFFSTDLISKYEMTCEHSFKNKEETLMLKLTYKVSVSPSTEADVILGQIHSPMAREVSKI